MRSEAAIVHEAGAPFSIEPIELEAPRASEVLVRMEAVGICHTDLIARDGDYPCPLPLVCGHEGVGIVEEVGAAVRKVAPGDRVLLSYWSCGHCQNCRSAAEPYCDQMFQVNFGGAREDGTSPISQDGRPVHGNFMGQSSFARHAVADERTVVKLTSALPPELLAPLACGVQTGAGAVANALRPRVGAALAIFGAGAVGLSALAMAVVAGCSPIVVVDVVPSRLELARSLGATDVVDASAEDPVVAIQAATGGGAQYSLEVAGRPEVLRQAVDCLRETGECVLVGAAAYGAEFTLDMTTVLRGRGVRGTIMGDSIADVFVPTLVALVESGRLPIDRLVTTYPFEQIDEAAAASLDGTAIKPVLVFA
ncbi:MAG: NAD(P)-dependent alcohol dehydrogenase [Actinobacteria bacterium]|nr:NAD(P)-dependent alcohol dehydrogenase [Actinomycetota bacterium]